MPSWNSLWMVVGEAKWMGFVRKKNKVSFFIGWKPFRVLSSFKPALSHYSFLIPQLPPFPTRIRAHTPSPSTPFYFLSSFLLASWTEEGSLFVHVLMLRIIFFRAPWAEAKMVLGEIFFTYGKFVYVHFHLRSELQHC